MMQQLMNSPMVQQMMSNPETGSEGSEIRIFFVLTDGLAVTILMLKKKTFFPSPQKKDVPKKGVSFE